MLALLCVSTLIAPIQDVVVPRPLKASFGTKFVHVSDPSVIYAPLDVKSLGVDAALVSRSTPNHNVIRTLKFDANADSKPMRLELVKGLKDEQYRLRINEEGIEVEASTRSGFQYGIASLEQWLERSSDVPYMRIDDGPRFKWRGMHLDCSRHFFTVAEVKQYIDDLARYKFNTFHWHLIDEGGWRMESKKYPKLTSVGAWRVDHPGVAYGYKLEFPGPDTGQKLYGGFYTQAQIKDVVAYAAKRSITTIPEIEMPGHSLPALVAYPEVTCDFDGTAERGYKTTCYCAGKEQTFKFVQDILDEAMQLFPSKIIHIGGDEVDQYFWDHCPDCRKRMTELGLKNTGELQSYFVKRIEKYLNSKGRTLMGWDEILEGGLAPNAMVMSWRGISGGIAAAKSGHQVVMSPTSHCYFDYGYEGTSTKHVYGYEPVPAELKGDKEKLVLGAQGNVWTEWIPTISRVQYMIFPRMMAMSEVLWSSRERRNYDDFDRRMSGIYGWLTRENRSFFVDPPAAKTNLVYDNKPVAVAFTYPQIPGYTLRYSTNGKAPTASSPIYSGPVRVSGPAKVIANGFVGGKPTVGTAMVQVRTAPANVAAKPFSYVAIHKSLSKLAEFSGSDESGIATDFSIAQWSSLPAVAVEWTGVLVIPATGDYTFSLESDDGSGLWIDGVQVVDNDGPHSMSAKTGKAHLLAGRYPFTLRYFDAGGARGFKATYVGPKGKAQLAALVEK